MGFEDIKPTNTQETASDTPTQEEIEEAKKDMHMTGRAMRVDETMEDYRKEREESWEKMKTAQAEKDQSEIERIRQEIAGHIDQKQEKPKDAENYKDLPNVKLCEEKLKSLLENNQGVGDFSDRAKRMIYEMLTRRSEFVKNTDGAGKDVADLMKNLKPQMEWYRNTRGALEKSIDSSGEFKWDSNPGWFGINTRPEAGKREGINIKAYTTIPSAEYAFIQHIPKLAKELRQLALESDDIIQVKIPESLSGFMSHNDSIVIHFKKKENGDKILGILNSWMQANSIHESPREMGRTKIAADSKDTSFSDLVAKNIASWLEQNAGKYDSSLLASEAVKHAIEQSQKSPI